MTAEVVPVERSPRRSRRNPPAVPGFPVDHRPVGRRTVRGRALARGPRVLRRRQPAASAALDDGRAGLAPGGPSQIAIVVDARGGVFFGELPKALDELQQLRVDYRILFLEAADEDPGEPVRGDPPPASAGARRPGGRGHPEGSGS